MNNTLLIIIAAYIAIGILHYVFSCFLFREVIGREVYLPLALESLVWPVCLIVDIAFAIYACRLMKPCKGDPISGVRAIVHAESCPCKSAVKKGE